MIVAEMVRSKLGVFRQSQSKYKLQILGQPCNSTSIKFNPTLK